MMEKDIVIPKGTLVELVKPVEISWLKPGEILTLKRGGRFKVIEDVKRGDKYIVCELIAHVVNKDEIERVITVSMQFLSRNTRRVEE